MKLRLFFIFCQLMLLKEISANELFSPSIPELFSCENMQENLKELFEKNPEKNFVFHIHGRGKYPEKAINYLPKFEEKYDVITMMFIWDAWSSWYSRPVQNAIQSASRLVFCLEQFQKFKYENKMLVNNRSLHFIIHSMGNIILKEILENYELSHLDTKLFDNIILNAADVPSKNHKAWLQKLRMSEKVYVTLNDNDAVLAASNLIDFSVLGTRRLGSHFEDSVPFDFDSTLKFFYLDFDKLSFLGHRHFLVEDDSKERAITKVYKHLFNNNLNDYPVKYKVSEKYPNLLIFYPGKK